MHPHQIHRSFQMNRLSQTVHPAANDVTRPGALRRWFASAARRFQKRRMTEALQRLDDHTLRDIGLTRGDIPRVVNGFDPRELRMTPLAPSTSHVDPAETIRRMAA